MHKYTALKTVALANYQQILASSEADQISLVSPALLVVTDFLQNRPLSMHLDTTVDAAIQAMRQAHVRSIIVTDAEARFRGIITVADLESRKVLSLATSSGQARSDLSIGELMTPKEKLVGVPISAIVNGSIGDLLQTLKHEGRPHMLVVEPETQGIRGIISASDIARRLRISVEINQRATSFKELVDIIAGREVA